jgi:hypothetical protein
MIAAAGAHAIVHGLAPSRPDLGADSSLLFGRLVA